MATDEKYWFKAKRYGWGWYPSSWQGWLSTGLFVLAILGGTLVLQGKDPETIGPVAAYIVWSGLCVGALLLVSYKKGEKPRWRWGK